jgi:eukaryotic-like serine/threonine-protein kinase
MGFVDRVKKLFKPSKMDVAQRFEIMRQAVHGTMSRFYVARDRTTNQIVGLKICDIEKTTFFENRFTGLNKPKEGEIASRFQHPLIVKTLEFGTTTHDEHYLIMEYLDGPGLNAYIHQKSRLLDGNRLTIMKMMAEALAFVHKEGFIHRDVCPRNFIALDDCRKVKLIDFGLTVPAQKEYMKPGNRSGTPNYMAPEVLRRRPTDHRLDIFAYGVTAYQVCTFEFPWPGTEVSGKAAVQHDTKEPNDVFEKNPRIHQAIGELIMQCLHAEPSGRPGSFDEILTKLSKIPSDHRA